MQSRNRRFSPWRACAAVALTLLLVLPEAPAYAQRARGGGGGGRSRGSVNSVNRSAPGTGGSWSNARSSGTTSRTTTGNSSSRTTTAQTRSGETATANRNVTKSGDEVTVNRNVQTSSGASKSSQKTYEMDDGRVESVERNTQATNQYGQTASWEGKAERSGAGWEFEGEGNNKYGQKVEAEGYGARGPYGGGVVADVEGGRYGDRTVVAGSAYGGPVHAASLPYGARPYNYHGHSYYGYGGAYYRPYTYHGVPYYGYMPPPWGCYYSTVPVGAIALTVAGMAMLYSDGTYYKTTYVEGATQYQVVAPPAGASLPAGTVAARRQGEHHDLGRDVLPVREHVLQARGDERPGELRGGHEACGCRRREGPARGLRADAGRQHGVLPLEGPLLPELPRPQRRRVVPGGRRAEGSRAGGAGPARRRAQGRRLPRLQLRPPPPSRRRSRSRPSRARR